MRVIDIMNKISKGEEIKDFTVDDGSRVFGVIKGLLVDKSNHKIVSWKITDKWLNCKVNFVSEKEDEDLYEYIVDYMNEIIEKIFS